MYNYELQPSRTNPDKREQMDRETQVVGNWEVTYHTDESKRITQWNSEIGKYVIKEKILPPELAERHWLIQTWEETRQEFPDESLNTDIF